MLGAITAIGSIIQVAVSAVKSIMSSADAKTCKTNVDSVTRDIKKIMSDMEKAQVKFQTDDAAIQQEVQMMQQQINQWNADLLQKTKEYNDVTQKLQTLQETQSSLASQYSDASQQLLKLQQKKIEVDALPPCSQQPLVVGLGAISVILTITAAIHLGLTFKSRKIH